MIKKITNNIKFSSAEKKLIKSIGILTKDSWDNSTLGTLRDKIKSQLSIAQHNSVFPNKYDFIECAYCGLIMDGTGRKEVEHIAHKAKHPEFSYHPENLVFACSHCNGSSKKGQKEVVLSKPKIKPNYTSQNYFKEIERKYKNSKFKILHPKRDDPKKDFDWGDDNQIILKKGITKEANESIKMFDLKSFHMTQERQKQYDNEQNYLKDPDKFEKIWKMTNNAR